jgi:hypothetical protein
MAFTKTSNPYWYIDDTLANVTAQLLAERVQQNEILLACPSNTAGKVFVIVKRGLDL